MWTMAYDNGVAETDVDAVNTNNSPPYTPTQVTRHPPATTP